MRNLAAKVSADRWPEFEGPGDSLLSGALAGDARQLATGIRADYANVLPSALACFEDDLEILHRAPAGRRSRTAAFVRTTISSNGYSSRTATLKSFRRLRREAGAQADVPERSSGPPNVARSSLHRIELRQIAAVRKDLDDEYQTLITPRAASSQPRIQQIQAAFDVRQFWVRS